ncbi:hypothetical protein [Aquiflexum sp.]|uniref:hypothetical protein n=1 Tax=Aquiflexum sp. TaxID=1872584 RepID=UPI003593B06B
MKNQSNILEPSHKISLAKAVQLIYSFLLQPKLHQLGTDVAIGAILDKDSLKQRKPAIDFFGSMSWFCRNQDSGNGFPKLFLAFEDGVYDIAMVPTQPKNPELVYSTRHLKFPKGVISENLIMNYLENNLNVPHSNDLIIPKSKVIEFRSKIEKDLIGWNYNRYYCSFFENRGIVSNEFNELLANKDVKDVAYFFGYDQSELKYYKSNRIRVILMGLDVQGKPVALNEPLIESPTILQASWPPPPNT